MVAQWSGRTVATNAPSGRSGVGSAAYRVCAAAQVVSRATASAAERSRSITMMPGKRTMDQPGGEHVAPASGNHGGVVEDHMQLVGHRAALIRRFSSASKSAPSASEGS